MKHHLRCTHNFNEFIYLFIIPDLSPVDYKIRSVVQQRVYQSRLHSVDELSSVWCMFGIDQTIIDNAINELHGRLCDCVWAKGGHFEQML